MPGGPLDTAELAVSGDFSVDVTGLSIFFDWIASDFAGSQLDDFRSQRDAELAAHKQDVEDMFSVNKVLGGFLKSLLNPAQTQPAAPPQQDVNFTLAYRTVEIRPTGIIMHGSLGVTPWPAAHVEYQPIPTAPNHCGWQCHDSSPGAGLHGTEDMDPGRSNHGIRLELSRAEPTIS